jgi:CDP-paratose 2-epimerase
MRILILGGAGFVGSTLARLWKSSSEQVHVTAVDNLKRRGSELNLPLFAKKGIDFVHGDVRELCDIAELRGDFDVVIDASAEPSVLSGHSSGLRYLFDTNVKGTWNFLEFIKQRGVQTAFFLSTSRVHEIQALREIPLIEEPSRFSLDLSVLENNEIMGLSHNGIAEEFSTSGRKSLYGATKFCSESFIQEFCGQFGTRVYINRCGVIAGPGQFGRTDQGVFTLWVANHHFGLPLRYTGFGGNGKQVRDLLHPRDLFDLMRAQLRSNDPSRIGKPFAVGGGSAGSVSLRELTDLCQTVTGRTTPIGSEAQTNEVDIPYYVVDSSLAQRTFDWAPRVRVHEIIEEIAIWLRENERDLEAIFRGK